MARYLALIGMVIVNFDVAMVGIEPTQTARFAELLQGRAAATFVVLAGLGFALGGQRADPTRTVAVTIRRATFLLVLGLVNMTIFPPDIVHYYAFYFLLGLLFIERSNGSILAAIAALTLIFPTAVLVFDYDAGWNWKTADYFDIWTVGGFFRNLVFNGWHPIVPWLALFFVGVLLGRMQLDSRKTQAGLFVGGLVVFTAVSVLSHWLTGIAGGVDPELRYFFTTDPVRPMPLFIAAGAAAACAVTGLCLLAEPVLRTLRIIDWFTPAGRQTLSLYIAHILVGMGILEALGMIGGQTPSMALAAAVLFCLAATLFAYIWSRVFQHGPIEALMRRIS